MKVNRRDGAPVLVGTSARILERNANFASSSASFDEAWLQKLLFDHPECLPIQEIEPGFDTLISVCRELPTERGPLDNLFMTGRGDIVVVEAKLWRNPEARRQVVAQALDYATALFGLSYAEFETAALRGQFSGPKPASLYRGVVGDSLPGSDVLDEPAFIDAVSRNLRRGRIVVLVVGDGIRAEAERLADGLQSHAGFHFTFALVELAVFTLPDTNDIIVLPRTLARTVMIERGIVTIRDGALTVTSAVEPPPAAARAAGSITADQYFEAIAIKDPALPARVKAFIAKLAPLGVYPDFQRSLNLKWDPPEGKPVNLGYIKRDGQIWTDLVNWTAPQDLSRAYITDLAALWGMEIEKDAFPGKWHVRVDHIAPYLTDIGPRLEAWAGPIERFIAAMQERLARATE